VAAGLDFSRTTNEAVAEKLCEYCPADTRYVDRTKEPKSR
jgi:hypothetical protein